ncbi:MAG: M64 family metallopeptidase [Planctomycetota bacterium]|jgi:hypothetical protein
MGSRHRTVLPLLLLLVPLALPARLPAGLSAQGGDEDKAINALARAMQLARKGKYQQAVATYKAIAKKYSHTEAGLLARQRAQPTAFIGWGDVERNGPSVNRVDIVIMGDGYRLSDQNDFDDVAGTIPKLFKKHKLLGEYYSYHNFVRANLTSKDQGVTGYGRKKDTALGGFVSGKVQNQVAVDGGKVRRWLKEVPDHDGLTICIVKAGSMGTGGRGIATIGGRADDTVIHEWGHAFGGLADEYSTFTGHRGTPRNSINISTSEDPKRAPWYHWIKAKAPGIGTYRGGAGRIKGVWRPTASGCAMQGGVIFCRVCREAMILKIYRYVDPIESCSPDPKTSKTKHSGVDKPLTGKGPFKFEVATMRPKTHGLEVSWWVLPASEAIEPTARGPFRDRRRRGRLQEIQKKPTKTHPGSGKTRHGLTLFPRDMKPGRHQVVCRVRDKTRPSGQTWPWVLADPKQLLQSERVWWVDVRAQ